MTASEKMELIPLVIKTRAALKMADITKADPALVSIIEEILKDGLCFTGIDEKILDSNY